MSVQSSTKVPFQPEVRKSELSQSKITLVSANALKPLLCAFSFGALCGQTLAETAINATVDAVSEQSSSFGFSLVAGIFLTAGILLCCNDVHAQHNQRA